MYPVEILGNTHMYTTAATGKLEFVPTAEVIDKPFEYATIYLAQSSDPSAIKLAAPESKAPSGKVVTVLTEYCSTSDSFVLGRHQDFNRIGRIGTPRERLTNDFVLGSPPLSLAVPIQASFESIAMVQTHRSSLLSELPQTIRHGAMSFPSKMFVANIYN
jgi:hypothetical protein